MLIGALQQMDIQDFSVVLFEASVHPVKLPDMDWEDTTIEVLMSLVTHALNTQQWMQMPCKFSARLLEESGVRSPKKMSIITDGYGSTRL